MKHIMFWYEIKHYRIVCSDLFFDGGHLLASG
jgi:hypothetical protein